MDGVPAITSSQPQKRALEDDVPKPITTPIKAPPSEAPSSPLAVLSDVPSPSSTRSVKAIDFGSGLPISSCIPVPTGMPPAKRRKLTEQEKEEKRLEKEAREKVKAEQRALKEEEKRIKDEKTRKQNEEREEKRRVKELAQQQKEEQKRKKDQSQMRLGSFFAKKAGSVGTTTVEATQDESTRSTLLPPNDPMAKANTDAASPQKPLSKNVQSEYELKFLPYQPPSRAILAPYNHFMEDTAKLQTAQSRLECLVAGETNKEAVEVAAFKTRFACRGARGRETMSVIEIVDRLNGSSDNPIDLTNDGGHGSQHPLALLRQNSMKYIHFGEDVRPPYYGTYTKPHSLREAARLARCPFSQCLHEANYDYDSEAEWEEAQEGDEDLLDDDEDDMSDDADEEMEGFLDDEDDPQVKRRLLSGDLQPLSSGLCWEDARGVSRLNDGSGAICTEFRDFRIGFLLDPQPQCIDPWSTAYWTPEPAPPAAASTKGSTITGMMNPPRLPLTQRPVNGMLNTLNGSDKAGGPGLSKPAKVAKRLIPPEHLPAFKDAVQGSDLTKIALIEHLKKLFPKVPKDAISNTLSTVAARVGAKEVDKRWVLIG